MVKLFTSLKIFLDNMIFFREVWMCLTIVYLFAIIPLAYTDTLSIRYLIENPGQIENMFWYVFGTFTNSLTFSGEMTWSSSKKTSTRLLIGKRSRLLINIYDHCGSFHCQAFTGCSLSS